MNRLIGPDIDAVPTRAQYVPLVELDHQVGRLSGPEKWTFSRCRQRAEM
jgi:hypothetical protein